MDKYLEALGKFEPIGSNTEVIESTNRIFKDETPANFTNEVFKFIHGCIDLTSLSALDSRESIWKLVNSVNDFEGTHPDIPNVAAICTYPLFTETVKQTLTAQGVKIAAVTGGFPASQTFEEIKVAETALAVLRGADEVDIVLNLGYLAEENFQDLVQEIQEVKDSSQGAILKVILETGALSTVENIKIATVLAIYAGADFVKTSTGKDFTGATPEAVYTICKTIKRYHLLTGKKIGIKVSGGIRKTEDAVNYYTIVKSILGDEWLDKSLFRIGASSLANDILRSIGA